MVNLTVTNKLSLHMIHYAQKLNQNIYRKDRQTFPEVEVDQQLLGATLGVVDVVV